MSSFINRFGGAGGMVGQASINRALASGMSINQIRSALSSQGVGTGAKATQFLASKPASSYVSQYGGTTDQRATGLSSVQRAIADGMTIGDIQAKAAQEGFSFGPRATQFFADQARMETEDKFGSKLKEIQGQFKEQFQSLTDQLKAEKESSAKALEEMRGSFTQAMSQRQERPRVDSVKFADRGTGGATRQQQQRRGIRGTFGRAGDRLMKISSLNV